MSSQIAMLWLVRLRWCGLFGQAALFSTAIAFGERFPIWALLILAGIVVLSNLLLSRILSKEQSLENLKQLTAGYLMLDVLLLTATLYLTGGASNPFSIFYLVFIVLAAVLLDKFWTWATAIVSGSCFALLFIELLEDSSNSMHQHHHAMSFHLQGMLLAFIVAACVISYFLTRILDSLRSAEKKVQELELLKVKQQRLAALTTLAAGAAHDLGTPLSSVALAASELKLQSVDSNFPAEFVSDIDLIISEVGRCKTILEQMGNKVGNVLGEMPKTFSLEVLIDLIKSELGPAKSLLLQVVSSSKGIWQAQIFDLPQQALIRAIVTLLNNAFAASRPDQMVVLRVDIIDNKLQVEVVDQGVGMSQTTLEKLGQPFFSSKSPDQGIGLGIFLTKLTIDQLHGTINFVSSIGKGTTARFSLPLHWAVS